MGASLLMSKISEFTDAKQTHAVSRALRPNRVDASNTEKRHYRRTKSGDRLFIQVVSCNKRPDLIGTTLSCQAIDVSAGGIRIDCSDRIPVGSKLDLWVDIGSRPGKFFLSSNVRWVEEKRGLQPSFELGVELQDGAATDIQEWQHVHQ